MSDIPDSEPAAYELVYPFVACRSNGGPYDDDAYAAGWEMGALATALSITAPHSWFGRIRACIRRANLAQADLIAMHCGATVTVLPWGEGIPAGVSDEWAAIEIGRV